MKEKFTRPGIYCALLLGLVAGCAQKQAAIKEGRISELRWTVPDAGASTYTLRRVDKADAGIRYRGGVEMYGALYPTCLEVRFGQNSSSHVQIIPISQIVWLEFGEGAIDKK